MDCPIPFVKLIKDGRFPELNYDNFNGKYSNDECKFLYGYILINIISPYTGSNNSSILYYNGSLSNHANGLITYKFTRKPTATLSNCIGIKITRDVRTHKIVSIVIIDSYYEEKELLTDNTLFGAYITSLGIYSNTDDTLVNINVKAIITQELVDEYSVYKHTKLIKLT